MLVGARAAARGHAYTSYIAHAASTLTVQGRLRRAGCRRRCAADCWRWRTRAARERMQRRQRGQLRSFVCSGASGVRCSRRPRRGSVSVCRWRGRSNGRWRRRDGGCWCRRCMHRTWSARRLWSGRRSPGEICAGGWKRAPGAGARSGSRCALSARGWTSRSRARRGRGGRSRREQLHALARGHSIFFSEPLCARYFTCSAGGAPHFVLFDDADTIRRKLAVAAELGIGTALLDYGQTADVLAQIFGDVRG